MGEAKGVERKELEHISNGYSRDLLQRFTASGSNQIQFGEIKVEEESEDIELNLGLSLGGRFGVDPNESNKLYRSTSIAGLTTLLRENGGSSSAAVPSPVIYPHLDRTTSLQTEEEWRKRKEMQSLRRMEAKRKRSEKQRNLRIGRESRDRSEAAGCFEGNGEEKRPDGVPVPPLSVCMGGGSTVAVAVAPKQQQYMVSNGVSAASFGLQNWAARGSVVGSSNGKATIVPSPAPAVATAAQGSVGSQGSRSSSTSGMPEFDSRPVQGSSNVTEARSPASVQSLPEQNETKTTISPTSTTKPTMSPTSTPNGETGVPTNVEGDNASKKPKLMENGMRESGMKVMEEMPCVSTTGDGPNGRKIEGFLYKYNKGEEVRIVCVCHGRFLSPAEFVEHAGGGEVAHPLRRIVVNPSPSFL